MFQQRFAQAKTVGNFKGKEKPLEKIERVGKGLFSARYKLLDTLLLFLQRITATFAKCYYHFQQLLILFSPNIATIFAKHCCYFYDTLLILLQYAIIIFARKTQRINKQCRICIKHIFISFSAYCRQFRKIAFLFCFRNVMNHALTLYRQYEAQCRLPQYDARKLIFCVPYIYNGKRQQVKKQVQGACNVIKEVSFSSFKFSIANDRNSKIQLWSLHGVGGRKHSLKFRFVKQKKSEREMENSILLNVKFQNIKQKGSGRKY